MNNRSWRMFGVAMISLAMAAWACDDGLQEADPPELQVENDEIELPRLGPDNRARRVPDNIVLENVGRGPMEVLNIEWVERPERIEAYFDGPLSEADSGVECEVSEDCSEGATCLSQANLCRDLGFPSMPVEVRPDATFSQNLVVTASDHEIDCPERPQGEDVPEDYCGELAVETDAINVEGTTSIYLVTGGGSGVFDLPDTYMEFTLAAPGVTQTKELQIGNTGSSPLEMERINFDQNPHWFNVTPSMGGTVIDAGTTETFTLELTPPGDATEDELEFRTQVSFASSSTVPEDLMTIDVTAGIGDAPRIEVHPMQLSFENDTSQTLTIENHGGATLPLNSMELRPQGAIDDYYTVLYEGTDVLQDSSALPNISRAENGEPSVAEFTVEFTAPTGDASAVGDLRINHQDSLANNRTVVTLLGDSPDVAIGEFGPTPVNFRSDGGEQTRKIALANLGNDTLEITDVTLEEVNEQTDAADYAVDGLDGLVVEAGEIAEVTVTYSGSNQFQQHLRIVPDSNHVGQESLAIDATASHLSDPSMDIDIIPSFPAAAGVGELTSFSVDDEAGLARLDLASWYLHARPAGSEAELEGSGQQATMVPDVAGDYRISVVVDDNDSREVQHLLDFHAE